jgi:NTE family protein
MNFTMNFRYLIFGLLFIPAILFAQENFDTTMHRPKVGLVLSGGGAKGIAHVGVLKALELEGIRPDYIAGTSMGSIVGGLYAIGYTADQLDTIVRQIDWAQVLSNNIPLQYIAYEEKEYYSRYLIELPIYQWKLQLPTGMIQSQMLDELLSRYTWPAKRYNSFDDFPIPFRCLATDVSTGKSIVFKDGSLAKAMRGSMAIPTAFTAVDLDTTLVVDGGIVDNFPVDELFKMGADIVIGVNVSHGFQSAYDINSMTGILMQVSMIPSSDKLSKQIEQCHIYIAPDLDGYSTASFSSSEEILKRGYEAGEKSRPQFRDLAKTLGAQPKDNFIPPSLNPDSIVIGDIQVRGNKLVTSSLILSKLQIESGDTASRHDIEMGVRGIYGINDFEKVVYTLHPMPEVNTYVLIVKVVEKTPAVLKGSVHYDNIFGIGIVANLTIRNILGKSSRAIVAGDISESPKFRFDYLKYMGLKQKYAFNFTYNYLNEKIPLYSEGQLTDVETSVQNNISANLISTQSLRNSVAVGVSYRRDKQKQRFNSILPEGIKYGLFNTFTGEILFTANTLNDRNYPTNGRELLVGGQVYFYSNYKIVYDNGVDSIYIPENSSGTIIYEPVSESEFNSLVVDPLIPSPYVKVQFNIIRYFKLKERFQMIPSVNLGATLSTEEEALFQNYSIGGHQRVRYIDRRFLGLNYAEQSWDNFAMAGLFFQNIIFNNLYLKYGGDLLLPYQHVPLKDLDSFSMETMIDDNSMVGYGVELTYRSFLGPISLGVSRNTRDSYFRYYFAVGFSFNYSD